MAPRILNSAVVAGARVVAQRHLLAGSQQRAYGTALRWARQSPFVGGARHHTLQPSSLLRPAACALLLPSRQFSVSLPHRSAPPTDTTSLVDATPVVDAATQPLADAAAAVLASSSPAMDLIGRAMQKGELASLGLAGSWPPGLLQQLMEVLCVEFSMPWWQSIVAVTIGIRLFILPIAMKAMRNNIILSNLKPEMDDIQARMKECFDKKDHAGGQKEVQKLQSMFTTHQVHPAKSLLMPLVQMPLFISFFLAIKRMAELPVESMKTGGCLWFTDLTVHDPYYILPVGAGLTMLACLELGTEGVNNQSQPAAMKNAFRIMSLVFIPVMAQFPAALLMYWCTNNMFSLSQLALLKIPAVKKAFNIPAKRVIKPNGKNPKPEAGFIEGFKMAVSSAPPAVQPKPVGYPSNYVGFKPKGKGSRPS